LGNAKTTEAKIGPACFRRNDAGSNSFRGTPAGDHSSRIKPRFVQLLGPGRTAAWKKRGKQSMPILQLLTILIVVGVLLWLVNNFIPMQSQIKSILNAVVVIGVVLWVLNVFGLFHSFSHIRVGS
jgi:hypothetical protein